MRLLRQRLSLPDDLDRFNKLARHCANDQDAELFLVSYRHLLPDRKLSACWPLVKRPLVIGYLLNEDIVFYNDLDTVLINYLRNEGADVIAFRVGDLCYKASKAGIEVYINDRPCHLDGFLSYGYRKKTSMEAYLYVSKIMEAKGVVCLHANDVSVILDNKLLQSIHFAKASVPIPDTYQTFDVESTKALVDRVDDIVPCMLFSLNQVMVVPVNLCLSLKAWPRACQTTAAMGSSSCRPSGTSLTHAARPSGKVFETLHIFKKAFRVSLCSTRREHDAAKVRGGLYRAKHTRPLLQQQGL